MTRTNRFIPAVSALCLCLALGLAPARAETPAPVVPPNGAPPPDARPEGVWAGQSTCAPTAGWCEDQQVVFHIRKNAQALVYDVDMNTLSDGVETPDIHLTMVYSTTMHTLTARLHDDRKRLNFWALAVKGDSLAGVLLIDDRKIERSVKLKRQPDTTVPAPDSAASASSASSSAASSSGAASSAASSSESSSASSASSQ